MIIPINLWYGFDLFVIYIIQIKVIVILRFMYFKDSGAFGIFISRTSWSANEEVRLLDAIEQFGFGNWEDIAKHIETRTPEGK